MTNTEAQSAPTCRTKWFWNSSHNGWRVYGIWWRQRVLIGVSIVVPTTTNLGAAPAPDDPMDPEEVLLESE